jgi:ABC-type sugar transport system ATPase subunit
MPLALTPPKGISAVVTHNILDVMAVTDRLVILHRGCKAAEVPTRDTNEHIIVSLIMGRGCASKGKGKKPSQSGNTLLVPLAKTELEKPVVTTLAAASASL